MEGKSVILSWSFANWLTVILMAAVGFAFLAVIQKIWITVREGKAGAL